MARKKNGKNSEEKPTAAGLPTLPTPGIGTEILGPEDLIIPRLVLVQPTSQIEGVEAGKFYMNLTGEEFDEIDAVFLKITKGRVYFTDANERKPACGSSDRIKPSARFDQPVCPVCGECSLSHWNGNEPPLCNEVYNLLAVTADAGLAFWWTVKSTAIAPTKRLLSAIALRARLGKNIFDAQVKIKSQLVTQPGKKYYVPVYTLTWLKDSSFYRSLYDQYVSEEIERTFAAEEAGKADGQGFDWETGKQMGDGEVPS